VFVFWCFILNDRAHVYSVKFWEHNHAAPSCKPHRVFDVLYNTARNFHSTGVYKIHFSQENSRESCELLFCRLNGINLVFRNFIQLKWIKYAHRLIFVCIQPFHCSAEVIRMSNIIAIIENIFHFFWHCILHYTIFLWPFLLFASFFSFLYTVL